jgi:hypothetical protein
MSSPQNAYYRNPSNSSGKAELPPPEPKPQISTFWSRTKATLKYNRLTKFYLTVTRPRIGAEAAYLNVNLSKWHMHGIFVSALIGKRKLTY